MQKAKGGLPGTFSPPKPGERNRGGERNRAHATVQKTPTEWVAGEFSDWMKVPTEQGLHGWPPHFVPQLGRAVKPVALLQTVQRRESDIATGKGWGSGTTVMPGTPGSARPAFMGRLPADAA